MRFITNQYKYRELLKDSREAKCDENTSIKILLVTDWSSQFLEKALTCVCRIGNLFSEITPIVNEDLELAMMTVERNVRYDFLFIIPEYQVLKKRFFYGSDDEAETRRLQRVCDIAEDISDNVVISNYVYELDNCFGGLEPHTKCVKSINTYFENRSKVDDKLICMDLFGVASIYGLKQVLNKGQYFNSKCAFSFDFLAEIARHLYNLVVYKCGCRIKCIVLDFDDTLYGGTISEEGVDNIVIGGIGLGESFSEFQMWLQEKKKEGILLAACTKNDEWTVQELFENNNQMILKKDDFAIIFANWDDKYKNIIAIANRLNIYLDSIMFLDDQSYERMAVKEMLPDVYVPELSDYPENRVIQLKNMGVFFGAEKGFDLNRTQMIIDEGHRTEEASKYECFEDYLRDLKMTMVVEPVNSNNLQRVSELSMRSNRCNLRTRRYSVADLKVLEENEKFFTYCFSLDDRIGEYGLIGVIVVRMIDVETCFIENIFMSCRVLNRGVEDFMMNTLIDDLKRNGYRQLIGEYIPTEKNGMMINFYKEYGFKEKQGKFILELDAYSKKKNYIAGGDVT